MQGPGGWLQLGFILNWKCLVPGVKAKPCMGHWDSCAQERPGCLSEGFGPAALGNREPLPARMAQSWAGQERGAGTVLCILLQTHKWARDPELFHTGHQKAPLFFRYKSLFQLSSPVSAFSAPWFVARVTVLMGQSMNIRIVWGYHLGVGRAGS